MCRRHEKMTLQQKDQTADVLRKIGNAAPGDRSALYKSSPERLKRCSGYVPASTYISNGMRDSKLQSQVRAEDGVFSKCAWKCRLCVGASMRS